jgi:predicted nucleotide-binding protein (sugar kinase/HSP70/actin superfamily)
MGINTEILNGSSTELKDPPYKIGIPRALYFFKFGALWKSFLESLGHTVVFSPPTSTKIVELGTQVASSELCIPMKIYFGHVQELLNQNPDLDFIFIPRYVSIHKDQYYCPKFLILPEAVKYGVKTTTPILSLEFNVKEKSELTSIYEFGQELGHQNAEVEKAWKIAHQEYEEFKLRAKKNGYIIELNKLDTEPSHKQAPKKFKSRVSEELQGKFPVNILVLGHPYNVYENHINIDLIGRLEALDCKIYTIEQMPQEIFDVPVKINQIYQQYWQTEDEILKTARYFLNEGRSDIDGVIFLISFACGPDSLIQEIVMRDMKESQIPYLSLVLDEHSGESGLVTRIQALIEMIRHKKY